MSSRKRPKNEGKVVRLLNENNQILKENQAILKESKAILADMNYKLRKIAVNTS